MEIVSKCISDINPITITIYRFSIGCITLAVFTFFYNKKILLDCFKYKKSFFYNTLFIGVLNVCISMLALQWAVYYAKASIVAIIISSNPIFVCIFSAYLLKEKFSLKTIIMLIVGSCGLFLVIFEEFLLTTNVENMYYGILFAIIASITYALYTTLSIKEIVKTNTLIINIISFFFGSIVLFLYAMITNINLSIPTDSSTLVYLLYLGIFVSGIAYFLFFTGLKNLHTTKGSSFFLLKPIFSCILVYFIFGEILNLYQYIGMCVVIMCIILIYTDSSSNNRQN
jgi:drug/metabolite transporter (DMT)-like permease